MDYLRQLDIFDPSKYGSKVYLIGAGAIGSMTALILGKMGISEIQVWDDDKVEEHNIPNQMYPLSSIGMSKVDSLLGMMNRMTDNHLSAIPTKWDGFEDWDAGSIVIVATDSMASRCAVWNAVKGNPAVRLFIDARMGGELMRIYTVDPLDAAHVTAYHDTLYPDDKAERLACTAQSIIYNLAGIAGFIGSQVKKALNGEAYPNEIIFDYKCMIMETSIWA